MLTSDRTWFLCNYPMSIIVGFDSFLLDYGLGAKPHALSIAECTLAVIH